MAIVHMYSCAQIQHTDTNETVRNHTHNGRGL